MSPGVDALREGNRDVGGGPVREGMGSVCMNMESTQSNCKTPLPSDINGGDSPDLGGKDTELEEPPYVALLLSSQSTGLVGCCGQYMNG